MALRSSPAGQAPAGLLATVLVDAKFSYENTPFLSVDTDANRLEIVFAIAARWMLRSGGFALDSVPRGAS